MTISATRDQVLAFRLESHNLITRRPLDALLEVAGACGVRNTPPGSVILAFQARLDGFTVEALDRAVEERDLAQTLSVRLSPLFVPADDLAIFTLGALPATDESLATVLNVLAPALKEAGMPPTEALTLARAAAHDELGDRSLSRGALSGGMTRRLPKVLAPFCRACQVHHVQESLFRLTGASGAYLLAPGPGKGNVYVRTDQWLGKPLKGDRKKARTALLRRYLRCFGPTTAGEFAGWAGISNADAGSSWDALAERIVEVEAAGRKAWLHRDDVARFESPSEPRGVRLLPPYDSYLDQRDRLTLLPDKALHRRVWSVIGNAGALLVDGELAGVWRPQKKGKRLILTVESFAPLSPAAREEIEAEAAALAPLRGCTSAEVTFDGG